MNKLFTFILISIFELSNIFSQNNLIIFSESAEPFQIEYQGKLYPLYPQADVKLTQITDNPVHLKILFSKKNISPIDTNLYLFHPLKPIDNQDILYVILKNNKTIKYLATLPSSNIKPIIPEIDTSIQVKTKEEKTIQKIIFLNDSNAVCIQPIDTADFNRVIKHISKTPNADRKIVLLEHFIKHNCFSPSQALVIIEQIPFEVEKLKLIKQLLPKITDVFDLWFLKDYLKYTIAQQSYTEYYNQYLSSLKNNPILSDSLFQISISFLKSTEDDILKLKYLRILLSHYSANTKTIEKWMNYLRHDQHKEELLKCAYYVLKDKQEFETLIGLVHFKETKNRLKLFYDKQK
jgi:hypothetical protein